jgi:hypothetical protein
MYASIPFVNRVNQLRVAYRESAFFAAPTRGPNASTEGDRVEM